MLSFQLPFHGTCTTNRIILHSRDQCDDFIVLSDINLEQMPDAIIIDNHIYKYGGVTDGCGQYWQTLEETNK